MQYAPPCGNDTDFVSPPTSTTYRTADPAPTPTPSESIADTHWFGSTNTRQRTHRRTKSLQRDRTRPTMTSLALVSVRDLESRTPPPTRRTTQHRARDSTTHPTLAGLALVSKRLLRKARSCRTVWAADHRTTRLCLSRGEPQPEQTEQPQFPKTHHLSPPLLPVLCDVIYTTHTNARLDGFPSPFHSKKHTTPQKTAAPLAQPSPR